jgi:hypothetical protein
MASVGASMSRNGGIEIGQNFSSVNERTPLRQQPISNFSPPPSQLRPEMKGPSNTDLDSILAGLKRKDAPPQQQPPQQSPVRDMETIETSLIDEFSMSRDDETVSVLSMKDLDNSDVMSGSRYKKKSSKRKPRSERNLNSVSIDL